MYEDRIEKGAALLDEKVPGWRGRINLATLDLELQRHCILGQLFGDFTEGAFELDIPGSPYGFDFPLGEASVERYATLTAEWKTYLTRELAEVSA